MKTKVIKTYDHSVFEKELNNMFQNFLVADVQTHTVADSSIYTTRDMIKTAICYVAVVIYTDLDSSTANEMIEDFAESLDE